MTKKKDKSRYAILGILNLEPSSGYKIGRMMEQSTNHFWQESDASIYPMLKILETEGKITAKSERTGKRQRTIYKITTAGQQELADWMAQPPAREKHRNELLLKIFFGSQTTKNELLNHLKNEREKVQATKKAFETIDRTILSQLPEAHPQKAFWLMTLSYGMHMQEAADKWLLECIKILMENK